MVFGSCGSDTVIAIEHNCLAPSMVFESCKIATVTWCYSPIVFHVRCHLFQSDFGSAASQRVTTMTASTFEEVEDMEPRRKRWKMELLEAPCVCRHRVCDPVTEGPVSLSIKPKKGKAKIVNVLLSDTVLQVKEKIGEDLDLAPFIPPDMLLLIFTGKILDESKTLSDCNIHHESTLRLVRLLDD